MIIIIVISDLADVRMSRLIVIIANSDEATHEMYLHDRTVQQILSEMRNVLSLCLKFWPEGLL